jgi:hypothetical protein
MALLNILSSQWIPILSSTVRSRATRRNAGTPRNGRSTREFHQLMRTYAEKHKISDTVLKKAMEKLDASLRRRT